MKKIFKYIFVVVSTVLFASACQEEPEPGGTATQDAAGEWYVHFAVETSPGVYEDIFGLGYVKILTTNTASNTPDSIWVTDLGNTWDFQVKAAYDKANKTFSATEANNISYDDSQVTIENGQILLGQGTSTSGVKTDSIYFVASFNDDSEPFGTKYVISGHRRTGFLEDEH